MQSLFIALLTGFTLAAAIYAHYRLFFHSASTRLFTQTLLVLVGLGFGWVMSSVYLEAEGLNRILVFLSAFGLVHVPAAAILFIKHLRGHP